MEEKTGLKPVPFEMLMLYLHQGVDRIQLKDDDPYFEQKSQYLKDIKHALGAATKSYPAARVAALEMGREGFQTVTRAIIEDGNGNNLASLVYLRLCKTILNLASEESGIPIEAVVTGSVVANEASFRESDIDVLTDLPRFADKDRRFKTALEKIVMSFRSEFYQFMPLMETPYHVGIHLDPLPSESREKAQGLRLEDIPDSLEEMAAINFLETMKGDFVEAPLRPRN